MIWLVLRRCYELPRWTYMYLHGLKNYEEMNIINIVFNWVDPLKYILHFLQFCMYMYFAHKSTVGLHLGSW